jgi:hypothetical protein
MNPNIVDVVVAAWRSTTKFVAAAPAKLFAGRDKETRVFRRLRQEVERTAPDVRLSGPDLQTRFNRWGIDLVCGSGTFRLAVEGKYKTLNDGAIPDNRKAAFFDLFKLEQYVDSGEYKAGLFLWLTDQLEYRRPASGDSADFSTHQGRVYIPRTPLRALRARNSMPLPLVLKRRFVFNWEPVDQNGLWCSLAVHVSQRRVA